MRGEREADRERHTERHRETHRDRETQRREREREREQRWICVPNHAQVQEADAESLQQVIPLPQDMCMLFRPLKGLFQLPLDQVIQFHQRFPKFPPLQLVQLVRLMQLQPMEILELRQLLTAGWEGLQSLVEDFNLEPMDLLDDNAMQEYVRT